ncbi:hypothetical protein PSPO01_14942 [Paraphaeosphaeria sporulosa]
MPPKKDDSAATVGDAITGFTSKETKMIAAAFVASTGPDKYDYELLATLTGNTAGSLKKMWPPVKRKVIEAHASFGAFLGGAAGEAAAAKPAPKPKANNGKKRKATSAEPEQEDEAGVEDAGKKKPGPKGRKKKADSVDAETEEKKPAVKRGRKKVKSEEDVAGVLFAS